jgi:hypothetical protein
MGARLSGHSDNTGTLVREISRVVPKATRLRGTASCPRNVVPPGWQVGPRSSRHRVAVDDQPFKARRYPVDTDRFAAHRRQRHRRHPKYQQVIRRTVVERTLHQVRHSGRVLLHHDPVNHPLTAAAHPFALPLGTSELVEQIPNDY